MELMFAKVAADAPVYSYEPATSTFLTSQPTVMDPLDRRNVYVADSTLGVGDGIFARRDIPAQSLVVAYAGFLVFDEAALYTGNMTSAEHEDAHKNLMSFNDDYSLNIPPWMSQIVNYRATLAHKSNHKFGDGVNVDFDFTRNPRFGEIRCLMSVRYIRRGEEIFVNYNYDMKSGDVPGWYRKLYEETYPTKKAEAQADYGQDAAADAADNKVEEADGGDLDDADYDEYEYD